MMHLAAWLLLLSPVQPPACVVDHPAVFAACERLAQAEEIWEPWDGKYYEMTAAGEWRSARHRGEAVRLWRERWIEFRDIPHLDALIPFACSRQTALQLAAFGRAHQQWLQAASTLARTRQDRDALIMVIQEEQWRIGAWEHLAAAQYDGLCVTTRRRELQALLEDIGPFAFVQGAMPPVVLVEYFQRID